MLVDEFFPKDIKGYIFEVSILEVHGNFNYQSFALDIPEDRQTNH